MWSTPHSTARRSRPSAILVSGRAVSRIDPNPIRLMRASPSFAVPAASAEITAGTLAPTAPAATRPRDRYRFLPVDATFFVVQDWNEPGRPGVVATMTTIGFIGSGNIGGTVARLAVKAGYDVVV